MEIKENHLKVIKDHAQLLIDGSMKAYEEPLVLAEFLIDRGYEVPPIPAQEDDILALVKALDPILQDPLEFMNLGLTHLHFLGMMITQSVDKCEVDGHGPEITDPMDESLMFIQAVMDYIKSQQN
jgi:hypothetical protein